MPLSTMRTTEAAIAIVSHITTPAIACAAYGFIPIVPAMKRPKAPENWKAQ